MPYIADLFPIDLGEFIGIGPALSGTFTNVSPGPATDTAAASTTAPFRLSFASATPPPPGVAALHVANSGPVGDLFRSGPMTAVPPSPGTVTAISVPTSLTTLLTPAITAMAARLGGIPLTPPGWVVGLMAAMSLGAFIPVTGAILGITPAVNTPPGSVTLHRHRLFRGPGPVLLHRHHRLHCILVKVPDASVGVYHVASGCRLQGGLCHVRIHHYYWSVPQPGTTERADSLPCRFGEPLPGCTSRRPSTTRSCIVAPGIASLGFPRCLQALFSRAA